jgi:hypothetical protein
MPTWPIELPGPPEDRWSILNSSRAAAHDDPTLARYAMLLYALDGGWKVEPPVYVRGDWSLQRKTVKVFHFVLRRDSLRMTTLLSVPDGEAVRRLIEENGWSLSPNETAATVSG